MSYLLKNLINTFTYPFRMGLKFSRPIYKINNESKQGLFSTQETLEEEAQLVNKYCLQSFKSNSRVIHYKETLYWLKLLEDNLKNIDFEWDKEKLKVLDIGSKNFSYALSLHKFFSHFHPRTTLKRTVLLDGIELDPYKIMLNLHSRYDYALYYIKDLPKTRYIPGDFLTFKEHDYNVITWFLPFMTKKPLLNWGLPLKFFNPQTQLEHAYTILNHQGIIFIVNQTSIETKFLLEIIKDLGLNYIKLEYSYSNEFSPFTFDRHITIIKKD